MQLPDPAHSISLSLPVGIVYSSPYLSECENKPLQNKPLPWAFGCKAMNSEVCVGLPMLWLGCAWVLWRISSV